MTYEQMKALYRVEYPQIKDATANQLAFNAANQRKLNSNFQLIQDNLFEIGTAIEDIDDYVVAQGLSGNWFYRQYANGAIEAWSKTLSDTAAILTATGSLYTTTKAITLPDLFANVDFAEVQAVSTSAVMTSIKEYTTTSITVHLLSATQSTVTLSFFVHVIGRV